MLTKETTKQPNAIEEHFCKPFEKLKRHPMDEESFMILARLIMIPENGSFGNDDKPFLFKVIEKRIPACFTFKINDERLIMFLAMVSERPGRAVMYLTYLQYWCKQRNVHDINLDTFCQKIFPAGFPSGEDLSALWDQIKVDRDGSGSDNLLDYQSAMQSIQYLPETVN